MLALVLEFIVFLIENSKVLSLCLFSSISVSVISVSRVSNDFFVTCVSHVILIVYYKKMILISASNFYHHATYAYVTDKVVNTNSYR